MEIPDTREFYHEKNEDAGEILKGLAYLVKSCRDRSAALQLLASIATLVATNERIHTYNITQLYSDIAELYWDAKERRTEPNGFWGNLFGRRRDENLASREALEEVTGFVQSLETLHQRRMNNSVLTRLALFALALERSEDLGGEESLRRIRAQLPPDIRQVLDLAEGV